MSKQANKRNTAKAFNLPRLKKSSKVNAVIIGGGTGAPVSIKAALALNYNTSAIVSMVDDGGSTGVLREKMNILPPGDIRKCIVAMAKDEQSTFCKMLKIRFEELDNHSLGNFILSGLEKEYQSLPKAIEICEKFVEAKGHVIPSTLDDITLCGTAIDGAKLEGQFHVSHSLSNMSLDETIFHDNQNPEAMQYTLDFHGAMKEVHLKEQGVVAYDKAVDAIKNADLIILGPGSIYSSIIPNLLVDGIVDAIKHAHNRASNPAITTFMCSIADGQGETWNMNAYDCVKAICDFGMMGILDYALIHQNPKDSPFYSGSFPKISTYSDARFLNQATRSGQLKHVKVDDKILDDIKVLGTTPIVADFVDPTKPTCHKIDHLTYVLDKIMKNK